MRRHIEPGASVKGQVAPFRQGGTGGVSVGVRRVGAAVLVAVVASLVSTVAAQGSTAPPLAWGSNDHAQLGVCSTPSPDPTTPGCAAPKSSATPLAVPNLGNVTQVSAGRSHTLALRADGTVMAWGRNIENELGDGHSVYTTNRGWTTDPSRDPSVVPDPSPDNPVPVQVQQRTEDLKASSSIYGNTIFRTAHDVGPMTPLTQVNAVAAGWYHNLALKSDGTVWAWGENNCGELGNNKPYFLAGEDASPPAAVQVPNLSNIVAIAAGLGHSLALDKNGVVWAWGENRWGQLGNGESRTPQSGSCFMPDSGYVGYAPQTTPVPVALPVPAVAIAGGSDHSLALSADGTVFSWGNNCAAQLGSSPDAAVSALRSVPGPVLGLPANKVVALGAGGDAAGGQSLALTSEGKVWAWGLAEALGGGTTPGPDSPCLADPRFISDPDVAAAKLQKGRLAPGPVLDSTTGAPLGGITAVDGGLFHSLALGAGGKVWAWGRNDAGQIGPALPQTAPEAVTVLGGSMTAVSAGSHSVVLPVAGFTTTTIPTTTTTTLPPPPPPVWQPNASMNVPRRHLATAVGLNGRIYALGGTSAGFGWAPDSGDALASAEVFDPCGTRAWSLIAPMPTPRVQFAAATGPDGRIYAIGGRNAVNGTPLGTVDAYDPANNTWTPVAPLPMPRANLLAATGPDGHIYAIGGYVGGLGVDTGGGAGNVGEAAQIVESYDTTTNQWTEETPTSESHVDQGATTANGRIYAIGGGRDEGALLRGTPWPNANESYSPASGPVPATWRKEPSPQHDWVGDTQTAGAVTTGLDGLIYDIGGLKGGSDTFGGVWIFDPVVQVWKVSPEVMTIPRQQLSAAAGKDGRIYAIGGVNFQSVYPLPDPDPAEASTEAFQVAPDTCPRPPQPADFDGNGATDVSVFRPSEGNWYVKDGQSLAWGAQGDIPVPGDYDGDRKTDIAIFRPATGLWAIHGSAGTDTFVTYGIGSDTPIPADYDGDGKTDMAIYRPEYGTWWIHRSSDNTDSATTYGISGDVPVPADYDGDGKADLGIFRGGTWFAHLATGVDRATNYGAPGDVPVTGDYDGDHTADMAVLRPSDGSWFLHHSSGTADEAFGFGAPGDVPQPGDYNGDGITDPAVFRPATGQWFIETGQTYQWGIGADIPLPLPYAVRLACFGGP